MTPAMWVLAAMAFVAFCWAVGEIINLNRPLTAKEQERINKDVEALKRAADHDVATRPRVRAITEQARGVND